MKNITLHVTEEERNILYRYSMEIYSMERIIARIISSDLPIGDRYEEYKNHHITLLQEYDNAKEELANKYIYSNPDIQPYALNWSLNFNTCELMVVLKDNVN